MLVVRIAGCAFAVSVSSASGPSKQRRDSAKPSAASASSNTARAAGNSSDQRLAHADLLRSLAGKEERAPGRAVRRSHHRTAADAQASPPPSAEKISRSPSLIFFISIASSSAVGTDADEVFP